MWRLGDGLYPVPAGGIDPWEQFDNSIDDRALWRELRDEILADWIEAYPCTRLEIWWTEDAPRCSDDQLRAWRYSEDSFVWHDRRPAEPRRRLGGTGTPSHEVLAYMPGFYHGVPVLWVSQWDADYYNGRVLDIHGHKVGPYSEGHFSGLPIDPNDPPEYESEAAYLQRHGLLTPAEERYLSKDPALLESEIVLGNE